MHSRQALFINQRCGRERLRAAGPHPGMEDSSCGLRQAPDHQPGSSGTSLEARFQKHSRSLRLFPLHGHPPAPGKCLRIEVVKPAQKVSDMKADDNFIRKLDLSMYYRYHQMRRDNYKNKE